MPDSDNTSVQYFCRSCKGVSFHVCWYEAPLTVKGKTLDPGWAIECLECNRVTLLPKDIDYSEMQSSTELQDLP